MTEPRPRRRRAPAGDAGEQVGQVVIGAREIYDAVQDLRGLVAPLVEKVSDHETRLRRVEVWMWAAIGAAAVAGGITGHFTG